MCGWRGRGAVVDLADGRAVAAKRVVLATGHEAPAGFPGDAELREHPGWVGNPWEAWEERIPAEGGTVVLLGAGLTAVDAIVTLRARGWMGVAHIVSRNGWLPASHFRGVEHPEFPPAGVDLAGLGLKGLVALVEEHCGAFAGLGRIRRSWWTSCGRIRSDLAELDGGGTARVRAASRGAVECAAASDRAQKSMRS